MQATASPSWREVLSVHPAAKLFPRVSEEELNVFAQDIRQHGLKTKITLWNDGTIDCVLDGITRLDALQRAGIKFFATETHDGRCLHDFKYFSRLVDPALDPYAYVISANIHRRHLTAEQKRELIAKLLKAKPEASNVAIAKQVKADDKTVAKVRRDLERRSEIPNVEKRTDSKGRAQPATKPKLVQPPLTAEQREIRRVAAEQVMQTAVDSIFGAGASKQTPDAPAEAGAKNGPSAASKSRHKAVAAEDIALSAFDNHVLRLLQMIRGRRKPERFAKTAVNTDDLSKVGKFLTDLAGLLKADGAQ
jgi:hypothetical protein